MRDDLVGLHFVAFSSENVTFRVLVCENNVDSERLLLRIRSKEEAEMQPVEESLSELWSFEVSWRREDEHREGRNGEKWEHFKLKDNIELAKEAIFIFVCALNEDDEEELREEEADWWRVDKEDRTVHNPAWTP